MATGKEVLGIAMGHLGEPYIYGTGGSPVPKNDPDWHGPWDCAEFVSWCVYQAGKIIYGCSGNNPATADAYTGKWGEDANNLGTIISIEEAASIPGAAVLRVPTEKRCGHIVISDGDGGTVEAMDGAHGVTTSSLNNRRWDFGILVPGIKYALAKPGVTVQPPDTIIYRVTSPFMTGEKIREIQLKLKEKGFDPQGVDGIFGPSTLTAVTAFQRSQKLVADGEVGPKTAKAMGVTL